MTGSDPQTVIDEASFLQFVRELASERCRAAELESDSSPYDAVVGWQNSSIEHFLEAAVAWAEDSDFGRSQGLDESTPPWQRLAAFLYAGKIYE